MAIAVKITSPQGAQEIIPLGQGALNIDAVAGASYRLIDTESPDLSFEAIIRRLGEDLLIDVLGTDADVRLVDYFFICELDYRGCAIELESIGGPLGEVLTPDNTSTTELSDGSTLLWATPPSAVGVTSDAQTQNQMAVVDDAGTGQLELSEQTALPWSSIGLAGGGVLALAALASGGGGGGGGESDTAVGADRAGRGTLATRSISLVQVESDAPAPVDEDGNSLTSPGIEIAPGPIAAGGQTNDSSPTLTGLLDAELIDGQRVAIYRDGQEIGQAVVDGLQWRFSDADVPSGQRAYAARIADGEGNQSPLTDDFIVTVDGTAPDAPMLQAVTGDNTVSAEEAAAGVAVAGNAEANATVTAQWGASTQSTQADGEGRFVLQFSPADLPAAGVQGLAVTATDSFGNVSESTVVDVRVSSANGIVVSGVVDDVDQNTGLFPSGVTINDANPSLVGVLDRPLQTGQSIQVLRNGTFVGTADVDGLDWTFTDGRLASGSYSHIVRVIDGDGTVVAMTDEAFVFEVDVLAPFRPSIEAVDTRNNRVSDATAADGVQVSGEAEAGSTIIVTWGDVSRTTRADTDGDWELTYDTVPVSNGFSIIRAVSEDDAGNQSAARREGVRTNVSAEFRRGGGDDDDADDDAGSATVLKANDLLEPSASLALPGDDEGITRSDASGEQAYRQEATLGGSGSPVLDDTFTARIDTAL